MVDERDAGVVTFDFVDVTNRESIIEGIIASLDGDSFEEYNVVVPKSLAMDAN